jgi:tellurite resistance protein
MHEQDKAILQSLVSVAWADGKFEDREREMLEALIETFGASDDEAKEIRDYASESKSLEDIPLNELSFDDRRLLMNHAVVLSWVDGEQADSEKDFLTKLCGKLNIPDKESKELMQVANSRAQNLLELLAAEEA